MKERIGTHTLRKTFGKQHLKKYNNIVMSIIELAHRLDMKVVAEGVETKEQADYLKEYGCDYLQGFYFSKPLPEEEFAKLLD